MTTISATTLAPLPIRGTAEHIADRLVTAIALGEFVPGQRLPPERELAQMLAVGRASVREALHRLAGAGYVEIVRGRNGGAYVRRSWAPGSAATVRRTLVPNWAQFEALLDLRTLIEGLIARTAAERHNGDDIGPIRDALAAYQRAADREESRAADQALHSAIAASTRNPFLANLSGQIRSEVSLGFQAEPYSAQLRETALEQHANLVDAVLGRRADDAERIAADHFGLTERALRELLARARAEEAAP
jgi:GntR family transcriptional regulator, transcriptional repressor for pyruvate dehydrogenase complex